MARAFPSLWAQYRTPTSWWKRAVTSSNGPLASSTWSSMRSLTLSRRSPSWEYRHNFLYTDAGIRKAYARLRPGGYFVLNRVYYFEGMPRSSRSSAPRCNRRHTTERSLLYRSGEISPWGSFGQWPMHRARAQRGPAPTLSGGLVTPVAWSTGDARPPTSIRFPWSWMRGSGRCGTT